MSVADWSNQFEYPLGCFGCSGHVVDKAKAFDPLDLVSRGLIEVQDVDLPYV